MAAEFVLTFTTEEILKRLGSAAIDGFSRAWGLKKELQKLRESTRIIQAALQDAEEKQATDELVKIWLLKLQEVVYSAEDVLDEFSYERLRRQVEIQDRRRWKVCDFFSRNNPILFRLKMDAKVKKINESLADIANQASREQAIRSIVASSHGVAEDSKQDRAITDSRLEKSETPIGRENEVEAIIDMLEVGSSEPPFLTVVSVVGFGGLGKTTLAKLVLEKVKAKKLFDKTIWVCVSETFDDERILGGMLEIIDENTSKPSNIEAILDRLEKGLENKRFLLVLDDVWNEDPQKCHSLNSRLQKICGGRGNFVIVTTRSRKVARLMGTAPQHWVELKQLPHDTCWSIIKNKWLEKWRESMPQGLETIGIEIAKKCGGVPLAAQVLGGTLCSNKDKEVWLSIKDSHTWEAIGEEEEDRILSVLKLSFDRLRAPVKRCFAYCSLFPKDFVFEKEQLIQLWMAEEFLHAKSTNKGTRSMEDVGEEYFNSLLASSFFQDAEEDAFGNIIECKMHDLLHDLTLTVSNTDMLQVEVKSGYISKTRDGRRLNFACEEVDRAQEVPELATDRAGKLRSVFCKVDVSPILPNFKRLRSLDMSDAKLEELPSAIGKLKLLRYLDISRNESIQVLPESITKLHKLQTFRLLKCKSLKKLPSNIRNLVSLRHIHFDDKSLMPSKVGCLTSLRTLPFFVVGVEEGHKIYELQGLNELRGELVLFNLKHVRDGEEAKRAKLEEKKLFKLVLIWKEVEENEGVNYSSSSSRECNHEDVLKCLQPSRSIVSLTIECCMGKQFPQWMSQLNKLVRLELKQCKKCATMPTLGHLVNLKILAVEEMDNIEFMGSEFYGEISNDRATLFPALEELSIKKMKSLVELGSPVGAEVFPKLQNLFIEDSPCLTSFPLSHLTSSVTGMEIGTSEWGGNLVDIFCFVDVKSLKNMHIFRCPKLTGLPISLTSLDGLAMNDYSSHGSTLHKRPKSFLVRKKKRPPSLKAIKIVGVVEMVEEFPKSLENLAIIDLENIISVDAFRGLSSLKHLEIEQCDSLQSIPTLSSLTSLQELKISYSQSLQSIPTLSSLTSLQTLEISFCEDLQSIPTLSSLTSLKHLEISHCESLQSIPTLSSLTSLQKLKISWCENLQSIPTLSSLTSLQKLKISGCESLQSIPTLSSLTSLQKLEIDWCLNLSDLSPDFFSTLTCLEELYILEYPRLSRIPAGIKSCHSLRELSINRCQELSDLSPDSFSALTRLEKLYISECPKLSSLPAEIKLCRSLKKLTVMHCRGLTSIADEIISSLIQLKKLEWGGFSEELEEIPGLNSIHHLSHPSLEKVTIIGMEKLKSLPYQLQHLTSIRELEISSFDGVETLPDWLGNLSSLQSLSIGQCKNLKTLPTAMQRLSQLTSLNIWYCPLLEES